MKYTLEFSLNGLPKRTNNIKSWRMRFAEARKWKAAVFAAVDYKLRPAEPLTKAKVTIIRFSSMPPDYDGMVSAGKYLIDGLVDAKVLVNDTFDIIGAPTYSWEKAKPKQGKVVVKVEAA